MIAVRDREAPGSNPGPPTKFRSSATFRRSQPPLRLCNPRRVGAVARAKFLDRIRQVVADGASGEEQPPRDLVQTRTAISRCEDLAFPLRQRADPLAQG